MCCQRRATGSGVSGSTADTDFPRESDLCCPGTAALAPRRTKKPKFPKNQEQEHLQARNRRMRRKEDCDEKENEILNKTSMYHSLFLNRFDLMDGEI